MRSRRAIRTEVYGNVAAFLDVQAPSESDLGCGLRLEGWSEEEIDRFWAEVDVLKASLQKRVERLKSAAQRGPAGEE